MSDSRFCTDVTATAIPLPQDCRDGRNSRILAIGVPPAENFPWRLGALSCLVSHTNFSLLPEMSFL